MCPVERERDPSGYRASGLTPELPVHAVLVPPLLVPPLLVPPLLVPSLLVPPHHLRFQALVPPLLRLQALVSMVQRQPNRVCYFLDCPRKFRLRLLWWLHKSSGFYSCRPPHCPVDASSLVFLQHRRPTSADVYPTDTPPPTSIIMKLSKTPFNYCSRHNWQLCINQYSVRYFLIKTEYLKKNQNKNARSHVDWSLCVLSASSLNCS